MKKVLFIITILFLFSGYMKAQDVIHLKNGKKIEVEVLYVKDGVVYYKIFGSSSTKVNYINKNNVQVIFFKNGMDYLKLNSVKSNPIVEDVDTNVVVDTQINNEEVLNDSIGKYKDLHRAKKRFQWHKPKNFIGLGADIFLQSKDENMAGISIDIYVFKVLNFGFGYGYFYGEANPYYSGKIIFRKKDKAWSPLVGFHFTSLDWETVKKIQVSVPSNPSSYNLVIPNFGYEYMNDSGFTFDVMLGASFLSANGNHKFYDVSLSFRVAGHL